MTSKQILLLFAIIVLIPAKSVAQTESLQGLWLMEHVRVGDQEMTPVAKWTRIHPDGSYESGNGWLKSSEGTWSYDENENTFLPEETNGLKDPFGAFAVEYVKDGMTWTRLEEGMNVVVKLKKISELPKAPADEVQGLWDLVKATEDETSVIENIDPEGSHYLFIRWDRIYVERDGEGNRSTGYWHMNGHRPEIILMSHNEGKESQSWSVSFDEKQDMVLKGISDFNQNQTLTYTRINEFPK